VLVTHRLAGLTDVDEILVLAGGRIVQRGTHDELVSEPGWYREAWLSQREDAGLVGAEAGAA
jgi:ABC-type transport system involved in Fe-S cluster assembly fused permease/ATPase subunit